MASIGVEMRNVVFNKEYRNVTNRVPRIIDHVKFFCGFLTLPAMYAVAFHPLYAKDTQIRLTAKAGVSQPFVTISPSAILFGRKEISVELPMKKPLRIKSKINITLNNVETF